MEGEILAWIESVLDEKLPPGTYEDILRDGVVLCKLMKVILPGSVPRINTTGGQFKFIDNINFFRLACIRYGLKDADLFQTVDLYEKRNIPAVTQSILALGRACSAHKDFTGPKLIATSAQETFMTDEPFRSYSGPTTSRAGDRVSTIPVMFANGQQVRGAAFGDITNIVTSATGAGASGRVFVRRPYQVVEDSIKYNVEREITETTTEYMDNPSIASSESSREKASSSMNQDDQANKRSLLQISEKHSATGQDMSSSRPEGLTLITTTQAVANNQQAPMSEGERMAMTSSPVMIHEPSSPDTRMFATTSGSFGATSGSTQNIYETKSNEILKQMISESLGNRDRSRTQSPSPGQEMLSKYPKFVVPFADNLTVRRRARAELKSRIEPRYDPTMVVEWFKDDVPIVTSNRVSTYFNHGYAALIISGFDDQDNGRYTCVATNSCGTDRVQATLRLDNRYQLSQNEAQMRGEKIKKLMQIKESMRQKAERLEAKRKEDIARRAKLEAERDLEARRRAEQRKREARFAQVKKQAESRKMSMGSDDVGGAFGRSSSRLSESSRMDVDQYEAAYGGQSPGTPYRELEDSVFMKLERTIYETVKEFEPDANERDFAKKIKARRERITEQALEEARKKQEQEEKRAKLAREMIEMDLNDTFSKRQRFNDRYLSEETRLFLQEEARRKALTRYEEELGIKIPEPRPFRVLEDSIIYKRERSIFETIKEFEPEIKKTSSDDEEKLRLERERKIKRDRDELIKDREEPIVMSTGSARATLPSTVGQQIAEAKATGESRSTVEDGQIAGSRESEDGAKSGKLRQEGGSLVWKPYQIREDSVTLKRERTIYETVVEFEEPSSDVRIETIRRPQQAAELSDRKTDKHQALAPSSEMNRPDQSIKVPPSVEMAHRDELDDKRPAGMSSTGGESQAGSAMTAIDETPRGSRPYQVMEDSIILRREREIYETIKEFEPKVTKKLGEDVLADTEAATLSSSTSLSTPASIQVASRPSATHERDDKIESKRDDRQSESRGLIDERASHKTSRPYQMLEDSIILRREREIYETVKEFEDSKRDNDEDKQTFVTSITTPASIEFARRQSETSDSTERQPDGSKPELLDTRALPERQARGQSRQYQTTEDSTILHKEKEIYETVREFQEPTRGDTENEQMFVTSITTPASIEIARRQSETRDAPPNQADRFKATHQDAGRAQEEPAEGHSRQHQTREDSIVAHRKDVREPETTREELATRRELSTLSPKVKSLIPVRVGESATGWQSKRLRGGDIRQSGEPSADGKARLEGLQSSSQTLYKYPRFTTKPLDNTDIRRRSRVEVNARIEPIDDTNMRVQWFKDDLLVEPRLGKYSTYFNFGHATLIIHNFEEPDDGRYSCVATNNFGTDKVLVRLSMSNRHDSPDKQKAIVRLSQLREAMKLAERMEAEKRAEYASKMQVMAKLEIDARIKEDLMRSEARRSRDRKIAETKLAVERSPSRQRYTYIPRYDRDKSPRHQGELFCDKIDSSSPVTTPVLHTLGDLYKDDHEHTRMPKEREEKKEVPSEESDGFEEDSFIYTDLKKSESPSLDEAILKDLSRLGRSSDPKDARRKVVITPSVSSSSSSQGE